MNPQLSSPQENAPQPNPAAIEEAARRYLECYGMLACDGSQAARMRCAQALVEYDRLCGATTARFG